MYINRKKCTETRLFLAQFCILKKHTQQRQQQEDRLTHFVLHFERRHFTVTIFFFCH